MSKPIAILGIILAAWPAAGAAATVDAARAGAIGDGAKLDTTAIQGAIDSCAAAGGGTVRFPAGRYLTGTLQIRSGVTLHLDQGATLLGSPAASDYRNLDPFTDGSGNPMGYALIVAVDAAHVGIEGEGTIDGQGPQIKARQNPFSIRPFLVRWVRCRDVVVRGVHLANPGAWTLNFSQTRGAVVEDVTIRSREERLTNNDGINIDSSEHIRVRHCDVVSGDDALVIKSTSPTPCRDIVASDCELSTRTNAIKLGTESLGGFEDISISHCRITQTEMSGIALYTVDGGDLQHVSISDVAMDGVAVPISLRLGSRLKTFRAGDQPKPTGRLRDVTIQNVSAKNVGLIGLLINGVPGHRVEEVTLKNITLEVPGGGPASAAGINVPEQEAAYPEYNMF
ncbi:MAG TPA: glycosyl hydrolase family 28 protein, partial [Opitutaceae bacterium]|nr:glycosyl hydrolase family 28 protein [Opitutaceae bacterium]